MNLLLDTHILLWAGTWVDGAGKLSTAARDLIAAPDNTLHFSAVSVWETAIKTRRGRPEFGIDPAALRRSLLDGGYLEVPMTSLHAAATRLLPPIHSDPFDRLLLAQAFVEGLTLVTADDVLGGYPGPVRLV